MIGMKIDGSKELFIFNTFNAALISLFSCGKNKRKCSIYRKLYRIRSIELLSKARNST